MALSSILSIPGQPTVYYPEFSPEAFHSFLESAPYGRDVKPLLELLAANGRDPERRIALSLLQLQFPHIVLDSQKTITRSSTISRLTEEGRPEGRLQIALSDGPVLYKVRGLFSRHVFFIPDSPDFYRDRALAPPNIQSLSREAPSIAEKTDSWGIERFYQDGSTRLKYSNEQMAGALLRELLRLDSMLRGWDSDPYHTQLRVETAQFEFYRDLATKTGKEPVLDADTASRFLAWQERPEEYLDLVLQTLSSPRGGLFDPRGPASTARQEIEVLKDAGAVDPDLAKRTMEILPPVAPDSNDLSAWIHSVAGTPSQYLWLSLDRQARKKS